MKEGFRLYIHALIDTIIDRVYEEGRNGAIADVLKIIDDELASWERVRKTGINNRAVAE